MTETRILRNNFIAVAIVASLLIIFLSIFPEFHIWAIRKQIQFGSILGQETSLLELLERETRALGDEGVDVYLPKQLRLELPSGMSSDDVTITQRYVDKSVDIHLPGINEKYFYNYPIIGSSAHIDNMIYAYKEEGVITLQLDGVYEVDMLVEDRFIYIDFVNPRDIYDKIVVIDPGHGGKDPGASAEGYDEKDINLAIALKIKETFAENEKVGIYYTRSDDVNPSYESRAALARDLNADLFLSVHNNSTDSGRQSGISGASVMYKSASDSGASLRFAEIVLQELLTQLDVESKGTIAGDEIYIIRTSDVPVALAEIGFMTNPFELARLVDEEYQTKVAQALHDAIIKALEEING